MTNTDYHSAKLRRLRIVQALARVTPNPMGEMALLSRLRADPELAPDLGKVRADIDYLGEHKLILIVTLPDLDWRAGHLSPYGRQWLTERGDQGLDIYSPDYLPAAGKDNFRGRVSAVDAMDPEGKAWLDQQLVERNFSGYVELADELDSKGYVISKSAVGRYGKKYKNELKDLRATVEMAKGFAEVVGDDAGALAQTLTGLAQQEAIAVLRDRRFKDDEIDLPKLFSAVAQINKSDIGVKKYAADVRRKTKVAAEKAEQTLTKAGASEATTRAIKRDILGIAA